MILTLLSIGELGEQLVAKWLESQGWQILHSRWRCRWGEIDLIAYQKHPQILAFVEVKTRSKGNWDADGILAITPSKQAKIAEVAQIFLSQYPHLADLPCRFDVALVYYRQSLSGSNHSETIQIGQPFWQQGYKLILRNYLESAF